MLDFADLGAIEARLAQIDPSDPPAPEPADDAASFGSLVDGFGGAAASPDAAAAAAGASVVAAAPPQIAAMIDQTAARYGVDPALVRAVVNQESGFDQFATSGSGAQGLMQLMPETAASLGVADPYDAAQNIDGGVRYLRRMLDEFGGDVRRAVAAYNAGPGAVERYGGVPPYAETQNYVVSVLAGYAKYART